MTNNLYTLYNKRSQRYGNVMTFPNDDFAINEMSKAPNGITDDEYELCRIGTIDIESGIVNSEAPVRVTFVTKTVDTLTPETVEAINQLIHFIRGR